MNLETKVVTYFGSPKIPIEISRSILILPYLSTSNVQKVIALVALYLTGDNLTNYDPEKVEKSKGTKPELIANQVNEALEKELEIGISKMKKKSQQEIAILIQKTGVFSVLFTCFYEILRSAIRSKMELDKFKDQLIMLSFENELVKILSELYNQKLESFISSSQKTGNWFNKIIDVRWRVDVTLNTSQMNRVFKPYLLMQFELSNGQIKTFEVSLKQFHNLRLSVASLLNDMNSLDQHRIMQIVEK